MSQEKVCRFILSMTENIFVGRPMNDIAINLVILVVFFSGSRRWTTCKSQWFERQHKQQQQKSFVECGCCCGHKHTDFGSVTTTKKRIHLRTIFNIYFIIFRLKNERTTADKPTIYLHKWHFYWVSLCAFAFSVLIRWMNLFIKFEFENGRLSMISEKLWTPSSDSIKISNWPNGREMKINLTTKCCTKRRPNWKVSDRRNLKRNSFRFAYFCCGTWTRKRETSQMWKKKTLEMSNVWIAIQKS